MEWREATAFRSEFKCHLMRKSCLSTLCKTSRDTNFLSMLLLFSIVYLALFFFLVHLIARLTKYLFVYCPSFPIKMQVP